MSETYSKPCQISKMTRHIENPGIIRAGLFRHFHARSVTFGNIQRCSDILKEIKTYRVIFRHY